MTYANMTTPVVDGTTLALDIIGSTGFPRNKMAFGPENSATDVSSSNPLPVTLPGAVAVTGTFWQATQPVSGTVGVSGSVAVTGTFWQATQPVSLASQPLPTGASTETTLAAMSAKLPTALVGGSLSVALGQAEYETVAASASDQILGATGAVGDYLAEILIIPGTTNPGAVSIKDGNGSAITIFAGGASSVSNLVPFAVPLGIRCTAATTPGWKITTGTNVTAIGVGDFT